MSVAVQIILAFLVAMFIVYVLVDLRAGNRQYRDKTVCDANSGNGAFLPFVSVLLPIYNEKHVVEKLLNAVCAIDYPKGLLEILVLDDSTDETSLLAEKIIARKQAQGVQVFRLRREKRVGYKAGNLNFGLEHAKGDFIAIFDADCLPPANFLLKVMPFFSDEKVGFLQTGIAYHNSAVSFLTRFQAMEACHKEDVTEGFARDGFMASLTGSSCVWRRKCIESIGGISDDTITEDVDMGYAAQLDKWTYVYPRDVVSLAELPETMAAFRVQRQRWARGLAHNAARHAARLFSTPMSWLARIHALTLVFSPLLLALFYVLLLLAPFIAMCSQHLGMFFHFICILFLLGAIVWGWTNTSSSGRKSENNTSFLTRIADLSGFILMFFPLSLYYFSAVIQLCLGIRGEFHITPKGTGRAKIKHPHINAILLALEIFSFIYAAGTICLGVAVGNYWVVLYASLALGGFTMALAFSFFDSLKKTPAPSHVLITGASGSIGAALAREYAAPGVKLTLQGRNEKKLRELCAICLDKGAEAHIKILDLRDKGMLEKWADEISEYDPPDLLIANAGLNTSIGANAEGEPYDEMHALIDVNIQAVFTLVSRILPAMRKRKSGQIAIISSLAAYYGLVHTPTYCATKAALKSWGLSLRGWLQSEGIKVNVILPGYVDSPMCRSMPGPKPFLWQPERAAKTIRKGLERDWARISFPFPLNLGIWGLSVLPACLAMPIAKLLGYGR